MKKKIYLRPNVMKGRLAVYNFLVALEIETVYGNLDDLNKIHFYTVIDKIKDWILYNRD